MRTQNTQGTKPAKKSPARSKKSAIAPPEIKQTLPGIFIKVRPSDRERLIKIAKRSYAPLDVVVFAVVKAGDYMLHVNQIAGCSHSSTSYLWMCINREQNQFTEDVWLPEDAEGYAAEISEDAENIGRSMSDWCGSLVQIGLEALESPDAMRQILFSNAQGNFIFAAGFSVAQERGHV